MLSVSVGAVRRSCIRIPGRGGGGYSSSAPPAGGKAASDFRLEARIKERRYARAQSATPQNVSAPRVSGTRWEPQYSAGKSAALGTSLGVGPAPPVVCQAEPATPLPAPFLRVRLRRGHTCLLLSPHGQAGHSRPHPLPAVGADSVSHPATGSRLAPSSQRRAAGQDTAHRPGPLPVPGLSEEFPGGGRLLRQSGIHRDSRICGAVGLRAGQV